MRFSLTFAGTKIPGRVSTTPPSSDPQVALIADDAQLEHQPLALLETEIERIEKLVSVDRDTGIQIRIAIQAHCRGICSA